MSGARAKRREGGLEGGNSKRRGGIDERQRSELGFSLALGSIMQRRREEARVV